jgi:hypothetical protein
MFYSFISLLFSNDVSIKYSDIFKNSLKKWAINYDSLEENKAGAACIEENANKQSSFKAVGFSYQMFDIQYAKRVALRGCKEMKKKRNPFLLLMRNYNSKQSLKRR